MPYHTGVEHPFDRYAAFTNVEALKAVSQTPLRKCLRVNTLKSSVAALQAWAEKERWRLDAVPWCETGFFVEREDRKEALGKDLLHLLGHTYMQEASSMLPPVLLAPRPGETVLDMSAAPGSKSTQIAAMMDNAGTLLANDVQENRLWTLKSSLHRAGVVNGIVTKKVGQWFARHMTERFDRVLCDAPCTAQGTARKNPEALQYCSMDSIRKMARLQRELLESAVHAARVGGRIVYSTCTLTPEENEGVVLDILNKFSDQLSVLDPQEIQLSTWDCSRAVRASIAVQRSLGTRGPFPMLRIWPHEEDAEGFFCAVLEKRATTMVPKPCEEVRRQEQALRKNEQQRIDGFLTAEYGDPLRAEGEQLWGRGDHVLLVTREAADFPMPVQDYAMGLPFAKGVKDSRFRITHELATLRGHKAERNVLSLDDAQFAALLAGKDAVCPHELAGDVVLTRGGISLGVGLAQNGVLKNRLSRWLVQHTSDR